MTIRNERHNQRLKDRHRMTNKQLDRKINGNIQVTEMQTNKPSHRDTDIDTKTPHSHR